MPTIIDDVFIETLFSSQKDGLYFLEQYDLGNSLTQDHTEKRTDITFLTSENALKIAQKLDASHTGEAPLRSMHLLESALARPRQAACYTDASLQELAVILAEGIVRDHPFVDGNKRMAHLCLCAMLTLNNLPCPEDSLRTSKIVLDLALRKISVEDAGRYLSLCRSEYIMDKKEERESRALRLC